MGRGRNFNSETKPLRRVLTLSPSPALTPQPSTCSQSMSAELTQELMVIGRSCMRAELRSSEQKCLKHPGRKSLQNGARGQRQDCQSGLVSAQAKRLEIRRHLRVKKMLVLKLKKLRRIMMKRKKRRRRKKKRNKKFLTDMWQTSTSHRRNSYGCRFKIKPKTSFSSQQKVLFEAITSTSFPTVSMIVGL